MASKRIVRFSARDVLRLSAVEIEPNGSVITLGGKNGSGKSSCLNAIEMCLAGKRAMPEKPIREGAERAEIVIDLGDLVVERVITAGSDRLVVRSPDGALYPRPQEMLNKLFASIAFDPLRFASQEASEQAETLRRLAGLDLSKIDADRQAWFDQRTEVGRDLKRVQARRDAIPHHLDAPADEVSVAALGEELARRQAQVRERDRLQRVVREKIEEVGRWEVNVKTAAQRVADLERELTTARAKLDEYTVTVEEGKTSARKAKAKADAFVVDDPAEVQAQLASAEDVNRRVRENAERARLVEEAAQLKASVDRITAELEEGDAARHKAIAEAAFPVPGMGLTDAGVTMNGIPFAQASKAEQLRVSLAVGRVGRRPVVVSLFYAATKSAEREQLGEKLTAWLRDNPAAEIVDTVVTQSSDQAFHCLTLNLFYRTAIAGGSP